MELYACDLSINVHIFQYCTGDREFHTNVFYNAIPFSVYQIKRC